MMSTLLTHIHGMDPYIKQQMDVAELELLVYYQWDEA